MNINVTTRKTGGRVVATLVKGDNLTTQLDIVVPRMSGCVDMVDFAWAVNICAADGRTDIYVPKEVTHDADTIRFGWLPGGIATAVEGLTEFSVVGTADAQNPPVWQSATYYLRIDENVDAQPTDEEAEHLTELGKLIAFVSNSLDDVVSAGVSAVHAADRANAAAERAEDIVGKSEAAVLYTAQELDADQQAQAQQNIGAASEEDVKRLSDEIVEINGAAVKSVNGAKPDKNGNVQVEGGGSGGSGSANMYKLIETITIDADDIAMVSRKKEPDGTPYSYSAVCVKIEQPPYATAGTHTIKVCVTGDDSFDVPLVNNATYKTYGSIVVENRCGRYFADVGVSLANPTNLNVQTYRPPSLIGYYAGETIDNVYLYPHQTSFVNGTKIEIWGVRA